MWTGSRCGRDRGVIRCGAERGQGVFSFNPSFNPSSYSFFNPFIQSLIQPLLLPPPLPTPPHPVDGLNYRAVLDTASDIAKAMLVGGSWDGCVT